MQFRRCTCPDYELKGQDCKHIYAVMYMEKLLPKPLLEAQSKPEETVIEKLAGIQQEPDRGKGGTS